MPEPLWEISGRWSGSYSYFRSSARGSEQTEVLFCFSDDKILVGSGADQYGVFQLVGKWDRENVEFTKTYLGAHSLHYRGRFTASTRIEGEWSQTTVNDWAGGFELELRR